MNISPNCALCGNCGPLVDSHIVPRAFYGQYARKGSQQELLVLINSDQPNRVTQLKKGGIFARFLCESCERKLDAFDNNAHGILINQNRSDGQIVAEGANHYKILRYRLTRDDIKWLHLFAASLLWRAAVCGRTEFNAISLGTYEQLVKEAVESQTLSPRLVDAIGIWHLRFEGDQPGLDAVGQPLSSYKFSSKEIGHFHAWCFDYPNGRLLIRLGQQPAKQGFVVIHDEDGGKYPATLWTCRVSPGYPDWAVMVCPKSLMDDTLARFTTAVARHTNVRH